jgi:hypothetical protein
MRAAAMFVLCVAAAPAFGDASTPGERAHAAEPGTSRRREPSAPPRRGVRIKEPLAIAAQCPKVSLEREAADRARYLAAMTAMFKKCAARFAPSHWGPLGFGVTIGPDGEVSDATFDGEPAALNECLAARSKELRFPPRCGMVSVRWPISADAAE